MTYTTNYNLKKPGTDDLVDVGDLNDNADAIDAALAGKQDKLTAGAGIDITGNVISATGIIEKIFELSMDNRRPSYNDKLVIGTGYGNGYSAIIDGNETAQGGLFHNVIVTGIEAYVENFNIWADVNTLVTEGILPFIPAKPFYDANFQATVLMFTDTSGSAVFEYVTTIRVHYIELSGTEVVSND